MTFRLNNSSLLVFVVLFLVSCKNETAGTVASIDSVAKPGTIRNTFPAYGQIDPDSTDSVAAGSYLPNAANLETAQLVARALRDSLLKEDLPMIDSSQRKFMIHDIDLNADGVPETFVAFANAGNCSKEGCTVYLLDNKAMLNSVFIVSEFPVIVMNNITHGWCDLLVSYKGIQYRLKSDGRSYPRKMEKEFASMQMPTGDLPVVFDFQHVAYPKFKF